MAGAPTPRGYDVSFTAQVPHPDCLVTVGIDKQSGHVRRFLVRLHYQVQADPVDWEPIARFDHNGVGSGGHDIYIEGLHIDVATPQGTDKLHPRHSTLPSNPGVVIKQCIEYFRDHAQYFVDVYNGAISSGNAPGWPDGGDQPHKLIPSSPLLLDMAPDPDPENALSPDEVSQVLAEATGSTVEEIEQGAEELEIEPPDEAAVVDE
jgi:hypothetical protein